LAENFGSDLSGSVFTNAAIRRIVRDSENGLRCCPSLILTEVFLFEISTS
jgi:hypothetical protein